MHDRTVSRVGRVANRVRELARCALLVVPVLSGLPSEATAAIAVYESAGGSPADITPTRDAFRNAIGGGTVAGPNGNFGGLRREINWDGVPDARSDPNPLPADFFNVNSPRGVVFSTPGSGFLVSANAASSTPILFGFPGDLQTFSAQRLFAPVGSGIMDIRFFVPGTSTAATTTAFGAVFADADYTELGDATTMEFFDPSNNLIFSGIVPATSNLGLSFLGGVANAGERISRVRITTPLNFLKSNGVRDNEDHDFVIMDDFIYASPKAIPEPGTLVLGLLGLAVCWRSRKRA